MSYYKIEYTRYNEYSFTAYAETFREAVRIAEGLKNLNHVSNVKICGQTEIQEVLAL